MLAECRDINLTIIENNLFYKKSTKIAAFPANVPIYVTKTFYIPNLF